MYSTHIFIQRFIFTSFKLYKKAPSGNLKKKKDMIPVPDTCTCTNIKNLYIIRTYTVQYREQKLQRVFGQLEKNHRPSKRGPKLATHELTSVSTVEINVRSWVARLGPLVYRPKKTLDRNIFYAQIQGCILYIGSITMLTIGTCHLRFRELSKKLPFEVLIFLKHHWWAVFQIKKLGQ